MRKMTEGATAAVGTFGGGSLYDILECPFGSPIDKLKAAYRRLARKWHPGNSNIKGCQLILDTNSIFFKVILRNYSSVPSNKTFFDFENF